MRRGAFLAALLLGLLAPAAMAQEISGNFQQGSVKLGPDTGTCDATRDGAIRWNTTSEVYEFCDTEAWATLAPVPTGGGTPVSFSVFTATLSTGADPRKINFSNESFNTGNSFDLSTDRFTPTQAGKYIVTISAAGDSFAANEAFICYIYKNGFAVARHNNRFPASGSNLGCAVSAVVNLNGTTDYIEGFIWDSSGRLTDADMSGALLQGGGVMTMIPGWPDAIICDVTNPNWGKRVLFPFAMPLTSDGNYYYGETSGDTTINNRNVGFSPAGAYLSSTAYTIHNCNTSISALYAAGRAFNFVGAGGGSGDNLGSHLASQDLDLATNDILNAATAEIGLGSVGTPSLYFEADPNTGLFRGTADTLSVAAGGVETARFLTTASAVNYFTFAPSIGTNTVTLSTAGTGATVPITLDAKGASTITLADAVTASGTLAVTGNATFDTTTMFVDAASNEVGIGTAAPDSPLHVVGDVRIDNDTNTTNKGCIRYDGTGNKLQFSHVSVAHELSGFRSA